MADTDFDINAWESGSKNAGQAQSGSDDFDVFRYEAGNPAPAPSPTSVEGRPGVPRPQVQMMASNVATALDPTNSVAGPGEASYVAEADPQSQARMLAAASVGAGGAGAVEGGADAVAAIKAMAQAHPYAAKLVSKALEGAAATTGGLGAYKFVKDLLP